MEGGDAGVREGLGSGQETARETRARVDAGARLRDAADFDLSRAQARLAKPDLNATIRVGRTPTETGKLQRLSQALKMLVQGNRG
ncbi:hypothetical protein A2961_03180 [Candidatus Woesebacteria bacterium RIFCSPLOWO2_01_FULL_39_21]|uniref:Uncharacterized protein n=1 Tax=Candidatus Woesebacteria bacterium RIFCSPLOWO2_01_FULL_39_21 TaxID=1802519 RepID=A0A1F8BHB2_9BACT|nr:MAG: hypothetical protein A2691_02630 [Candidatus Woesebacteria bacterium RIFCSPHIGHO2_01_FULL_39_23]OGM63441.1 MAG: hypothetical protein A2961_03180 [Candidatus Woesebacteria bacterium RIFCSPLOWO2_01_FULL_39_21]